MYPVNMPVYQIDQIRELERLAAERFGVSGTVMMQRAGKAAFEFLLRRWPHANRLAVFCGGGNNGGDGYILAGLARERGLEVTVWQVGSCSHYSPEAEQALHFCQQAGVTIESFNAMADLHHPDVIVDAMCGIGLKAAPSDDVATAIHRIQRQQIPVLAIDIPTGVNADTGHVAGAAIHAMATMTFIGLKLGLLTGAGAACAGELVMSDLQLPPELFACVKPSAEKIHINLFGKYLQPRLRDWHKGLSGHLLVVGGEAGFSGAARMAAEAALRVGAGLVTVATRPECAITMNSTRPEMMCHGIDHADELGPLIEKADAIVLGPGLGQSAWAEALWERVLASELPLLVDADGLNLLAGQPITKSGWVLTPHPGEAARLLDVSSDQIQENRLESANAISKRYGGVCVLKGVGTLIVTAGSVPAVCDKGNPGMASAGMGDILSGVIGGLLAQRIPVGDAARLGVYLHAMAGDLAAKEGERGMIATDLLPHLRRLVN